MISVCMATYNGEKYIKEQLDSILKQLSQNDEIIISDDGSNDETLSIIDRYNDSRIKVYHHTPKKQKFKFGYVSKNFENALIRAKGDFIFLSDQDDVWLDDKVTRQVGALQHADLVLSDCHIVDESLNSIFPSKFKLENVNVGFWKNLYKSGYLGCCMAFKRELLEYILPIPDDVPHDLWIGLVVKHKKNKFNLLNSPEIYYRRHKHNVSATSALLSEKEGNLPVNNNTMLFKLSYRWYTLKAFWNKFYRWPIIINIRRDFNH
ncbi:glycosyltransferase involved in cell wall biosynthesis [Chryseobacterium sp. SORGH_AS909]|uniref:Glycosyltransferase involved in cell wall biosynthesis n=2 Tax=Chryseobacterium group TaxID=2782232 RepID=A0ABU0TDL1_9FLAO|nr:glycosyltransferase involved in cell wall biosynthesis [Chryseobacterium camelliae]MDQ1099076.1 glycosyltransferase involved in cell wall biosynthesis [Chryseobacterium sp. SORGH_AS_1048]MDR6086426.1 glycosyltransferase involved in cell wall biosynthesis [Chryseobacterium sp. SORGH_AS_0909]MDR6130798.1 glycosyltransferase involved in cell wall biosynthesis [Chryseobacterium sp. SORGH_AS_1175]MDT3407070.1 glycosyltransferase involved in cell wall biosynthesis [Pseudacidovorax intermedius]